MLTMSNKALPQSMSTGHGIAHVLKALLIATTSLLGTALSLGQNVQFRQISSPAGVIDQTSYPALGSRVSTVTAAGSVSGYRFTHWTINGARKNYATGRAVNPVALIATANIEAVAYYRLETEDSDGDGIADWYEIHYFGDLAGDSSSDIDGDGLIQRDESVRGYDPAAYDFLVEGGVSRRRAPMTELEIPDPGLLDTDRDGFIRSVEDLRGYSDTAYDRLDVGGASRRRSASFYAVLNPDYARLREASIPGGVLSQERIVAKGSTVNLTVAPDSYNGWRFTGWLVDGARVDIPPQNQPIPITVTEDTDAVARYVSETADTDGDGIPDWTEWYYYNSLVNTTRSDPDSDGIAWGVEQFRGYSVIARDELEIGGVSRRRSVTLEVDTTGRLPYRMQSAPAGMVTNQGLVPPGTVVTSPDLNGSASGNYRFVFWDVNGVRQTDLSGYARTQISFAVNEPTVATAHYVDGSLDSDSDGIPDWYEWVLYGSLDRDGLADTDEDGFALTGEYARGYAPLSRDSLTEGGVSRRRSTLTPVNTLWDEEHVDLLVTGLAVEPASGIESGSQIVIRWRDENAGDVSLGIAFYDRVTVHNATTGETVFNEFIPYNPNAPGNISIPAGGAIDREVALRLPDGPRGAGALEVTVVADATALIPEFDATGVESESNNAAQTAFVSSLGPYPDLVVEDLSVRDSAGGAIEPGGTIAVQWDVANAGTAPVQTVFEERVTVFNVDTGQVVADGVVEYDPIEFGNGDIEPDDYRSRFIELDLPYGAGGIGTLEVTVTTDDAHDVFEYRAGHLAEENNSMTVSVQSTQETVGPDVADWKYGADDFGDGLGVTASGTIGISASDRSGVSRVEFYVRANGATEDTLVGIDTNGSDGFRAFWNADATPGDGRYVITIKAFDTLGNVTTESRQVDLTLVVPPAPTITAPANGSTVARADVQVSGFGIAGRQVAVYVGGVLQGSLVTAASDGRFGKIATLVDGANQIQAANVNRAGEGPRASVMVTLDRSVPSAPAPFAASAQADGKIQLTWTRPVGSIVGYHVYRSTSSFDDVAQATKIHSGVFGGTAYADTAPADGTYYYRVTAVNAAGTEGDLSVIASAVSDRVLPYATSISYVSRGNFDAATGRFGVGLVEVEVTVNEPLLASPFLAITPSGGAPITVTLAKVDDLHYTGSFSITEATPSGVAAATVSMRDMAGNRGTTIGSGGTLLIATAGPRVVELDIQPGNSIKNNPASPQVVTFTAVLDAPVKDGTVPEFFYSLSNTAPTPAPATSVTTGATELAWVVTVDLPSTAGQTTENLDLSFAALDDLDNLGTTIVPPHSFQVYQGDLPGLDSPLSLVAASKPAGRIDLSWQAVEGAADYQVSRRAAGGGSFAPVGLSGGSTAFGDLPDSDGLYEYVVAAVRQENGETSVGDPSNVAAATSDRVAPPAPRELRLELVSQGVRADWLEPENLAETVTYTLSRMSAGGADSAIAAERVAGLVAVDAAPDPARAYYEVVAVDAAGNVSVPSNRAYQNVQLLPVRTLSVTRVDDNPPIISWSQVSGNIAGYDIYQGAGDGRAKLNPSGLITGTQYTDIGYSVAADRIYTVVTVDGEAEESLGRSLTLPRIAATLPADAVIHRGVMNRLEFNVRNDSTNEVTQAQIVVTLGGREHRSAKFSIGAGADGIAPVIVGGYAALPVGTAPIITAIEITPHEGEKASIIRNGSVSVAVAQLQLDVMPGEFVRGGSGKVGFRLANTSDVEIEITTGSGNGANPSPEVRFSLLDTDGNVLATQPFKVVTGMEVVTLPNGNSVVRLPAGFEYLAPETAIPVPLNAPKDLAVRLEIDAIYYHQGQADQVVLEGIQTRADASAIETTYTAEVTSVSPAESNGDQDVVIAGVTTAREGGQPIPNVPLVLHISKDGFERTYELVSDAGGNFSQAFRPGAGEGGGIYHVWAVHPDMTVRQVQQSFVIRRVLVNPREGQLNAPRNYAQLIALSAATGEGVTVRNLRIEYLPEDQIGGLAPPGVTVVPDPAIAVVAGNSSVSLGARISGSTEAPQTGDIILRVSSDESNAGGWQKVTVHYAFGEARPQLRNTPGFITTGVNPGSTVSESFTFENIGVVVAEGLTFSVLDQNGAVAPSWVSLTAAGSRDLAVGAKTTVDLVCRPGATVAEGDYFFIVRARGSNLAAYDASVHVAVTAGGQGGVLFKVRDPFTGTLDAGGAIIQGLSGARIELQNEQVLSVARTLTSDAFGEAMATALPAGSYAYKVHADKHVTASGRVWVRPGTTVNQDVALQYNPVTVEWEVVPVTIQDRYNIVLTATFETSVPTPVIVVDPPAVNLPRMCKGDVYNGEFTVSNHGLISAKGIEVPVPQSDDFFTVEILGGVPTELGPGEVMRVAYRMTARANFGGTCNGTAAVDRAPSPSVAVMHPGALFDDDAAFPWAEPGSPVTLAEITEGGGCTSYDRRIEVRYWYICWNGLLFTGKNEYVVYAQLGNCGSSSGGGTSYWSWSGPSGGGFGGVSYSPITTSEGDDCWGWLVVEGSWTDYIEKVGCSVDSLTRLYGDEVEDLSVPIPGRPGKPVTISRKLSGTQWSMFDPLMRVEGDVCYRPEIQGQPGGYKVTDAGLRLRRVRNGTGVAVVKTSQGNAVVDVLPRFFWRGTSAYPGRGLTLLPDNQGGGYLITEADNSWTRFDKAGNVAATGRNDVTHTTTVFDGQGRPSQITDGAQVLLTYEWRGQVGSETDPSLLTAVQDHTGRRVEYTYEAGRLTKVTQVDGGETHYAYDADGRITQVTDATGKVHRIAYSGNAVASVLDQDGRGKYFQFNSNAATGEYFMTIRSTSGTIEEKTFDKNGNLTEWRINGLVKERRVHTYLRSGRMSVQITDENGRVWTEEFNEQQMLIRRTNPDGTTVSFAYDPATRLPIRVVNEKGVVTTLAYDTRRNLSQVVEAMGTPSERRVQFVYDTADRLMSVIRPADGLTVASAVSLAYDAQGDLRTVTDPLSKVQEILSRTPLKGVEQLRDANGKVWNFAYDERNRPNAVTDPDNRVTQFEFDAFNNLTAITAPSARRVDLGYDINNSLVSVVDPTGNTHQNEYDAGGRLSKVIDRSGRAMSFEYDALDRPVKGYDASGNQIVYGYSSNSASAAPVTITFPTFARTIEYDFRGQPTTTIDTLSGGIAHTNRFSYSATGALVAIQDAEGHTTTLERDELDRVISITREGVGTSALAYDSRDNVISFTNPNGQVWHYEYDAANQVIRETTPLGKQTIFTYDNISNLTVITRPDGSRIERKFDAAGRVVAVKEYASGATSPENTVSFGRDADGRIASYDDGGTSGMYTYDDAGRLATETINYGTFSSTVAYTYEPNGQLKTYTTPSGRTHTYSYDSANRLIGASVTGVGEFAVTGYQFDAATGMTYPGGTKLAYARDGYSRPTQITSSNPANATLFDLRLGYSATGNVIYRNADGGAAILQYDAGNRLVQGVSSSYTYDANGNRLTDLAAGGGTWQYDGDDRLISDGMNTYEYDDNGSLVRKITPTQTWDYTYDLGGRLVHVTNGTDEIDYHYDPAGRRIAKIVNGVTTYYRHCAFGICAEYDGAGNLLREYGYAANASFGAAPLYVRVGTQTYFYHADQIGTPVMLTDSAGFVVWAATYDDFGKARVTVSQVHNNLRFPGQYFDAETGLHYNWNRYFDPDTGRYIARDPVNDGNNYYSYCENSPYVFFDANGLRAARYACGAYEENDIFNKGELLPGGTDGFAAVKFTDEVEGVTYVAFRGTELTSREDWGNNIGQFFGKEASQYKQAIDLAKKMHQETGGKVIFVGHSLGGGLATAAAHATGGRAIVFNPSTVSEEYGRGSGGVIETHIVLGDYLTGLQEGPLGRALGPGPAEGKRTWHFPSHLDTHACENFIE